MKSFIMKTVNLGLICAILFGYQSYAMDRSRQIEEYEKEEAAARKMWSEVENPKEETVDKYMADGIYEGSGTGFGGAKEILSKLGTGSMLDWSAFTIRLGMLCLLTILAGRIFCGWACAFGAVGDWIYQLSSFLEKKTRKRLPRIPEKVLHILQKLKYIVLAAILIICFLGRTDLVTKYSPWTVFSLITAGNFHLGSYGIAILLLLFIVVGMALQERFFCQCLCPMGAIFSFLPELPLTSWKRNEENCIQGCQACKKNCPVKIKRNENPLWEGECIRCGRCRAICPRKNILLSGKKRFVRDL